MGVCFYSLQEKIYLAGVKSNLDHTNKGDDLEDARGWNSLESSESSLHIGERKTISNIAGQSDTYKVR